MLYGQTGIRLREALLEGDAATALAEVSSLDEVHRVEILLGAALRDGRDDFRSARLFLAAEADGDWGSLMARLAAPDVDPSLDEAAAALVAARRAPDRWRGEGSAPGEMSGDPVEATLDALRGGVGGLALVDHFADDPLHAAVSWYYRRGRIHALGPRPLLILAMRARLAAGGRAG